VKQGVWSFSEPVGSFEIRTWPNFTFSGNALSPGRFTDFSVGNGAVVVNRASQYRRRAQQCLEMAAVFRDREARASLSYMAQVWLRLADNYRDANKVIAAPNGAVEVRPTVQQRQQLQPKSTS
jgi:hypothetical protein